VLIVAFTLVVAYPYIPGSGSEAFKGVSLFLGITFSLGSSSVIASVIAWYSTTYGRAFKVGDRIQVNHLIGDVVELRLLVTRLCTVKNEEIVVPNSLILNSHVLNHSIIPYAAARASARRCKSAAFGAPMKAPVAACMYTLPTMPREPVAP
jgi:small-conductance mechanosensitive channel